ncbi:Conserved_hypothetical protein [Hexamita inflata]|uniref:Uncharacterized protein n=1 Tax=Hexamita inflata TaxID=28002 RepID=A0ABP1JNJ7_9EUKA
MYSNIQVYIISLRGSHFRLQWVGQIAYKGVGQKSCVLPLETKVMQSSNVIFYIQYYLKYILFNQHLTVKNIFIQSPLPFNNQMTSQNVCLNQEQVDIIRKQKLSFYQEDYNIVLSFITDLFQKNNIYNIFQNKKQPIDQFLFIQSNCQKQNSDEWGRLFSFFINMQPEDITQTQQEVETNLFQILNIAQQLGIEVTNGLDYEVQQQLEDHLDSELGQQLNLFEILVDYVKKNIEIGYYQAFQMREMLIQQPSANISLQRSNLHTSLKQVQIMDQLPLNSIIQECEATNKKKLALTTYLFMSTTQQLVSNIIFQFIQCQINNKINQQYICYFFETDSFHQFIIQAEEAPDPSLNVSSRAGCEQSC